jgi:glyoxylase-like metal-dependent hydrolase (beta-lactamase superfamily II)
MANTTDAKLPVYVTVSALDAGHLTLPERLFVTDADPGKRTTVPSLSFLIQHPSPSPSRAGSSNVTNLVFDLGVKRDLSGYTGAQRTHIAQRQPVIVDPDCAASLRNGAVHGNSGSSKKDEAKEEALLDPARDVDMVILSHVHWDHVGTPSDFSSATFAVGSGTLSLLKNGAGPLYPAELFNDDELPVSRTVEFPPVPGSEYDAGPHVPKHTPTPVDTRSKLPPSADNWSWRPFAGFPFALDLFGDDSLYVIDSPGHLYGHINLLARLGEFRYVYLGGDCCHDPRILRGEKEIAMYEDGRGGVRSVHVDTGVARRTLDRIGEFVREKTKEGELDIEVVVAHDGVWRQRNRHRFWPGKL